MANRTQIRSRHWYQGLFKWAVFSVPAVTTLFQLLDQIHSGMFLIFFFSLYFVLFCGISMKYVERNTV